MNIHRCLITGSVGLGISLLTSPAFAQDNCLSLPGQGALRSALVAAVANPMNGGLGN
jgi:hypothetical protein